MRLNSSATERYVTPSLPNIKTNLTLSCIVNFSPISNKIKNIKKQKYMVHDFWDTLYMSQLFQVFSDLLRACCSNKCILAWLASFCNFHNDSCNNDALVNYSGLQCVLAFNLGERPRHNQCGSIGSSCDLNSLFAVCFHKLASHAGYKNIQLKFVSCAFHFLTFLPVTNQG